MREIEELAKPTVTKLLLGQRTLLTWYKQQFLASFLCLVSCRIEASGAMRSIPPEDRERLKSTENRGQIGGFQSSGTRTLTLTNTGLHF